MGYSQFRSTRRSSILDCMLSIRFVIFNSFFDRSKNTNLIRSVPDVVKSRIQLSNTPPSGANYIFNTFRSIYQKEGAAAFVRGLGPSCLSLLFSTVFETDSISFLQMLERKLRSSFSFLFVDLSAFVTDSNV